MATNEILRFAETDTGTNLLTQAEYLADSQRPIGNQPGVARSKLVNKALRQASLIAAGVAEFLADNQANNITDGLTPQNIADYLQAALTGALGVTPPQFDNDTSLATTAFVQATGVHFQNRAGGALVVNTTLTVSDSGHWMEIQAAGLTVTLPALVSCPSGLVSYTFKANYPFTLKGNSAESINDASGATANTLAIAKGETVTVVSNGPAGVWYVVATGFGSSSFAKSLATSGYQKFPSGLIVQWGEVYSITANTDITWTYPIAFPNACRSVLANSNVSGANGYASPTSAPGTSSCSIQSSLGGSTNVFCFAIGY